MRVSWHHDGKNKDGSAFDPNNFFGWDISVDGAQLASVPIGWETDGDYLFEGETGVLPGPHKLKMRLLTKAAHDQNNDALNSDYSPEVAFVVPETRKPSAPFGVAVEV